jgi:hypothetical protein
VYSQIFSSSIKVGLANSSDLSTQSLPKMALTTGFIGELKLAKWMRVRTEATVLWSGRNDHFWTANPINDLSFEVPLMLTFMPVQNLHIGGGAALNYHLLSFGGELPENRLNLGLLGHLEYRFFKRLGLGIRYLHQLSNFKHIDAIGSSITSGSKSDILPQSSLQLTLSYSFGK